ncbi:phosphoribosylamine--glycine ligase [bacterium]|nr:phosphoribosylamine--glycine ligase [bacterium]
MRILVVGGGGREHALAWKLAQSPRVSEVMSAPGNPGMSQLGRCFPISANDIDGLEALVLTERPHLVVVGPEGPLAAGIADRLRERDTPVFGPSARAAKLEASKGFAKALMARAGVPTAAYGSFTEPSPAKAFLDRMQPPYVLKADGLASGKGVVICETRQEAEAEIDLMLSGRFGAASSSLVIEEFMTGEEASFFALCDGESAVPFAGAQDHKRVGAGDTGPNTGGMGAYSPAPILDESMQARVMTEVVSPTLAAMRAEGRTYRGVLFVGLMINEQGPRVVEFNCRFGDPETQTIMMRLKEDPLPQLLACAAGGLHGCKRLERFVDPAVTVVVAAKGYPASPVEGGVIDGLDAAGAVKGVQIFHAGTAIRGGRLVAAGGRVLNVSATASSLEKAVARAYEAVDRIRWEDGFCRRDIGWRALSRG